MNSRRSRPAGQKRPTPEELKQAAGGTIPDVLAPGLSLLLVGINPSLYSAAVGHHFARPGNRFWPALADAGITDRQLAPAEDQLLTGYGCGLTNFVKRATARADELSAGEIKAGFRRLARLVEQYEIPHVAVLGITAWRTATGDAKAAAGTQPELLGSAVVHVLPNPSGLNAHYQRADFARLFRELWDTVQAADESAE